MNGASPTGLPPLRVKRRTLLPIVQGGMGVGISAHRLAGTVARLGAVGTIASVDLRRHHPDLMAATGSGRDKNAIERANLVALDREVRAALALADGRGLVAVNVMRAVSQYAAYVRQSCESGAQAIVVGAGLPLDLPDLAAGFPGVALIPILSDARGIAIVLRKWLRKGRGYLARAPALAARARKRLRCTLGWDCLEACGLRDGVAKMGQFCIDLHLGFALEGDRQRGLFFRGAGALPFGSEIRPARELVEYLLGAPAGTVTSARLPRVASA